MGDRYDAIVVGIGGMGSATAFHLSRRGWRVLGLERFDVIHPFGSSHGLNRIIRLAYSEHPNYVPLLWRAYELWRELEDLDGRQLLWITGSLEGGLPEGSTFTGALRACDIHGLDHEVLSGDEVNRRWPAYHLPEDHRLVHQPEGGFLASEDCILAHVRQALANRGRAALARTGPGVGGACRRRLGADRYFPLRGETVGGLCRVMGGDAPARSRRGRGPRAAGAGLPAPVPAQAVPPGRSAGLQRAGRGGPLLRLPGVRHPRVQVRALPPPGGTGRARRHGSRAECS